MNKVIKNILNYLLLFITSIIFLLTTTLLILKVTVFNYHYVEKTLEKINFYEITYNEIKSNMVQELPSTNIDQNVIDTLFTKDDIKEVTNDIIKSFYTNKEIVVNTGIIETKLRNNIDSYLKEKNIKNYDKKEVDSFINNIMDIYKDNLIPYETLSKIQKNYLMVNKILVITLLVLIVLFMLILLIKRYSIAKFSIVPLLFTSFVYLILYICMHIYLDTNNIIIYNDSVSLLIRDVFNIIYNLLLIFVIIYILLSIILFIIYKKKNIK